jgi:hypothetical protein
MVCVRRLAAPTDRSSGARDAGAPARSAPAILEKPSSEWRLVVRASGPKQALVVARRVGTHRSEPWLVRFPESLSRPETVLLALAEGVRCLAGRGARVVTLVVTDKTLDGYLRRGWRPRSLAMHEALVRFVEAASSLTVAFEPLKEVRSAIGGRTC